MKKKTKNKLIILMFVISLIIFLLILYLNSLMILEKKEIITTLMIGNKTGFDLNTTALTFGRITFGSSAQRNLIIKNQYDFPIKVEFSVKGDIKKFLVFEKIVPIEVGEEKTISITAINPIDTEYGNYSGKMIVIIKKNFQS